MLIRLTALFIERVAVLVIAAVTGVLIARHVGVAAFGTYSLVLALLGLVLPITDVGRGFFVADIVRKDRRAAEVIAIGMAATSLLSVGAGVVLVASSLIFRNTSGLFLPLVLVAASLLLRPFFLLDYYFQAVSKTTAPALLRVLVAIFGAIARLAVVWRGLRPLVPWLCACVLLEAALAALMYWGLARTVVHPRDLARGKVFGFLQSNVPITLAAFATGLYMKLDQVLLGLLGDRSEVGTYAAAVRLSEVWYFLPVIGVSVVAPSLLRLENDRVRFEHRYALFLGLALWGAVAVSAIIFIAAPELVRLTYGSAYAESSPVLRVHVLALIFVVLGTAQGPWTVVFRQQNYVLRRALVTAVANVGLCVIVIPKHGALGAAYATVAAYALVLLMNFTTAPSRNFLWLAVKSVSPVRLVASVRR